MKSRTSVIFLCLCLSPALLSAQTPLLDRTLVLKGVTVIDATGADVQANKTVIIRGDRIQVIVDASVKVAIPKGSQIISANGQFLIPGLYDMHVHLKESDLPILVAYGVTGVRDMGNILSDVDTWRAKIEAGILAGPQIYRVGPILNGKSFGPAQVQIETGTEARAAVRLLKQEGVDAIKVHGVLPREAYFALADEAKKLSIPFVGHVPSWISLEEASDAGQTTIEHMETLFDRSNPVKREDAPVLFARFVKNNTTYTPVLVAFRGSTEPENIDPTLLAKYPDIASGRKRVFEQFLELLGLMNRAGVNLMAGTDLGVKWVWPGSSLHEEIALMVEGGLTPMQALQAATRNPARLLRVNAGTVESGKLANLVLLDANPLANIHNTTRIRAVVLNGKYFDRASLDRLLNSPSRSGVGGSRRPVTS